MSASSSGGGRLPRFTRGGPTRLAALRAACRLKPAFQAVRVTRGAGATRFRLAALGGAGLKTGGPSRQNTQESLVKSVR